MDRTMGATATATPGIRSATPATRCRALSVRGLLRLFRRRYVSHLLVPALLTFVFVRMWWGTGPELVAFIIGSALLVSAAQRALFDTELFTERKFRRVFYRTMTIAVCVTLGGFVFAVLAVPFAVLQAALGTENSRPIAIAVAGLAYGFVFMRFWPAYVTSYLFRGTAGDLWGQHLHMKLPDLGIAWRLTAVPGTVVHATLPVAVATGAAVVVAALVTPARGTAVGLFADAVLFLVVLPVLHLLIVERAMVLAMASDRAFRAAMDVAARGPLWFVRDPSRAAKHAVASRGVEEVGLAPSLEAFPRMGSASFTWNALGEQLGLEPSNELTGIGQALTGAYRLMRGSESPSPRQPDALSTEEREALASRCLAMLQRARPLEARATGIITETRPDGFAGYLHGEHALLLASELLAEARPDLGLYESRLRVVRAYRELFDASGLLLKPEDHLLWMGEELGVPEASTRYRSLAAPADPRYWQKPVYRELWELPDEELPDDAMMALVPLLRVPVGSRAFEMEDVLPVRELLERYGTRLRPALIEYLRHPEKYTRRDPMNVVWWVDYTPPLQLACAWPRDLAEPIFRAALASGWDVARLLQKTTWGAELLADFENSPYRRM